MKRYKTSIANQNSTLEIFKSKLENIPGDIEAAKNNLWRHWTQIVHVLLFVTVAIVTCIIGKCTCKIKNKLTELKTKRPQLELVRLNRSDEPMQREMTIE